VQSAPEQPEQEKKQFRVHDPLEGKALINKS
jgi:hypothetical protein